MLQIVKIGVLLVIGLSFTSCSLETPYQKMLSEELASGVRNDSLFLGIGFGMEKKDFFTHCWEMNKEGIIRQGPNNLSVEYQLDSTMSAPVFMRFYPQFVDNKISRMPVEYNYQTFMPSDSLTLAEPLLDEVKLLMEDWYGDGFIYMSDDDGSRSLWVKVDGNRQIRIFKKDVATVAVDITDMSLAANFSEEK